MTSPTPVKILIAEDDEVIGRIYLDRLEEEGYEVILVKDGKEVVEKAKKLLPDLIILDVIMPVMDGFEALEKIKADPVTKGIKVLILSNLGQPTDIERARILGAVEYLVKANMSISEVVEKVKEVLKTKGNADKR